MRRLLALLLAVVAGAGGFALPAQAEVPPPAAYTDYSQAFVDFFDATLTLDEESRVAAFKQQVAPLFPEFYAPRNGATQDQRDRQIKRELREFPALRERYVAVQRAFPAAFAAARQHFARTFPRSRAHLPTYLLHSLGEMDGGTRELAGRSVLTFGVDGMARYHTPADIGPFFDHEFFHVEHGAYFPECEQVWCALWIEGLATAAAERMNRGIDLKGLMLETPRPIAPGVDAAWEDALCTVDRLWLSTRPDDYRLLFQGNGGNTKFAPRWGYYVGFRLAQRLLRRYPLQSLAHMHKRRAEVLVKAEFAAMLRQAGGCAAQPRT